MTINAALRLMSGSIILMSLALGYLNSNWHLLTLFVGLNLFQAGFTKWCPAVFLFSRLGLKSEQYSTPGMTINQGVHILAGTIVSITTALVIFAGATDLLLSVTAIIGISLFQSAFTGWCPGMMIARLLKLQEPLATHY